MEHPPAIIQKKKSGRHDILVKPHSQPKSQSHTVNRIASLTLMSHKHVFVVLSFKDTDCKSPHTERFTGYETYRHVNYLLKVGLKTSQTFI